MSILAAPLHRPLEVLWTWGDVLWNAREIGRRFGGGVGGGEYYQHMRGAARCSEFEWLSVRGRRPTASHLSGPRNAQFATRFLRLPSLPGLHLHRLHSLLVLTSFFFLMTRLLVIYSPTTKAPELFLPLFLLTPFFLFLILFCCFFSLSVSFLSKTSDFQKVLNLFLGTRIRSS